MSKIVMLLCVVLVVSAVAASGTKEQFETQQKQFESYFATTIRRVEEYNTTTWPIFFEKTNEIMTNIYAIDKKATDDVSKITSKALADINEVIGQTARSGNILDCYKMHGELDSKAQTFLHHVYQCTAAVRTAVLNRLMDIGQKYRHLQKSLIEYRNEIAACDDMFNKTQQVDDASLCTKSVEAANGPLIAESVPLLFRKIDEMHLLLPIFKSSVANCANGYAAFETEAADITTRAKECHRRVFA